MLIQDVLFKMLFEMIFNARSNVSSKRILK